MDRAGITAVPVPTPFPVGPVNCYLLHADPPILIDAGPKSDEAYAALRRGLDDAGTALGDLGAIVVTHGHLDHAGLLGRLREETAAPFYAHPHACRQWRAFDEESDASTAFYARALEELGAPRALAARFARGRDAFRVFGDAVVIDHALEDGMRIGPLEAVFVPGHAPSDVLFRHIEAGWGCTGDHLLAETPPNPLLRRPEPGHARGRALSEFVASLQRTANLELTHCFPGHGPDFGAVRGVIDALFARIERRTQRVLAQVTAAPEPPYAVMRRLYPDLAPGLLHMGLSVVVGHLELLEDRGQVVREDGPGVYYRRAGGC